uniref:G-protein coupled receptors family 1 profile domain-containing protein n=1 Tax=Daphnia galeata TaxID=27404 RepID=A0A8J2S413_9CRUS|nr:unnamed protein product [Daphnia galeata]
MEEHWYDLITGVLTAIAVFGSAANLAVIFMIARNKKLSRPVLVQLWNRQCILIMNVACADFILATFGIFMPLVSSVHRQWIFGDLACSIYAFVTTLVGIASETTLAFLALDRALKICQSNWSLRIPKSGLVIIILWIYSFLVSCPPLFGWGEFVQEGPGISCSVDWQSTSWNSMSYIIFLFTMGFLAQIFVMLISYLRIYFTIHQASSTESNRQRYTVAERAERRVACMLTLMVICYLFAWLPYTTVSIAKVWEALMGNSEKLTELNGIYGYLPALLAKSSITYNPVIYVLFNTQICRKGPNYSSNQVNVGETNKTQIQHVTVHQTDIGLLSNPPSQSVTLQMDPVSAENARQSPTAQ